MKRCTFFADSRELDGQTVDLSKPKGDEQNSSRPNQVAG
jgi:hypothetical protein